MDVIQRLELRIQHFVERKRIHPEAGDLWCQPDDIPRILIYRVDKNFVYVLENLVWRGEWAWDITEIKSYTREHFAKIVIGFSVMENKCPKTILATLNYHCPRYVWRYRWTLFKRWVRFKTWITKEIWKARKEFGKNETS